MTTPVSQTQFSQWFNQAQEMYDALLAEAEAADLRAKELRSLAKRVATVLPKQRRESLKATPRKCGLCGETGHRADTCPNQAHDKE